MKKILTIFLLFAVTVTANPFLPILSTQVSSASCGAWTSPIDQRQTATVNDVFNGSASQWVSQGIKVTVSGNVCKVKLKMSTSSGTADVFVQLRTAGNGGGSQIGSDSGHQTVTTTQQVLDFDFASPITVSSDFFIAVKSTDNAFRCHATNAEVYQGTGYSGWEGPTAFTGEDLYFEVWSQ
jgi:hypothetical protein